MSVSGKQGSLMLGTVALLLATGCSPGVLSPERLQEFDGVLYLTVRDIGVLNMVSGGSRRLYASRDRGRSWQQVSDADWSVLAFLDPHRGFAGKGGELYEVLDADFSAARHIHTFDEPLLSLTKVGDCLVAATYRSVQYSADGGRTWERLDCPEVGGENQPTAVAGDGRRWAVATYLGRVWVRTAEGEWSESIVGPVRDLIFHGGRFFALTSMGSLAVIEGGSVRHAPFDSDWVGQGPLLQRFRSVGDQLFFLAGGTLYRVVGDQPIPQSRLESTTDWERSMGLLALLDEGEAVSATARGGRIEFLSLRFNPAGVEELGNLPPPK